MADRQASLEQALAKLEADVDVTVKAARNALTALKKVLAAAHTGDLKELRKTRDAADQAIGTLQQQFANVREGWDFDEEAYLSEGDYLAELVETADRAGLKVYPQDGQLYSYPFLVRIAPSERAVVIDRVRERRLRPQTLVAHLKALQTRPVRFKPEAFLDALHDAYDALAEKRDGELLPIRPRVRLMKIYELLTMLPGLAKEYTRQEFARDIYLLDQSGLAKTRQGAVMTLSPASTSTKSSVSVLAVITQEGQQKKYYEISFSTADAS